MGRACVLCGCLPSCSTTLNIQQWLILSLGVVAEVGVAIPESFIDSQLLWKRQKKLGNLLLKEEHFWLCIEKRKLKPEYYYPWLAPESRVCSDLTLSW